MLDTGIRKLGRRAVATDVRARLYALAGMRTGGGWHTVAPLLAAGLVALLLLMRMTWTQTPDGDPALHLRIIKDIAATRSLPSDLPFHPARVGEGGHVEAMFPYSYPPLYHVSDAIVYSIGGLRAEQAADRAPGRRSRTTGC